MSDLDSLVGEIALRGKQGRVTVYRRFDAVTAFWRVGTEIHALHLGVEQSGELAKLLTEASETTPYAEDARDLAARRKEQEGRESAG